MLRKLTIALAATAIVGSALAHDTLIFPSKHNITRSPTKVAVDVTSTHGMFRAGRGVDASGITVIGTDGKEIRSRDLGTIIVGATRTTFELPVEEEGTYKLSYAGEPSYWTMFFYDDNEGEKKKKWLRNTTKENRDEKIEAFVAKFDKPNVREVESRIYSSSTLSFVTNKLPSFEAQKITGEGFELEPITDPSDYVTGEDIEFRITVDGEPVVGLEFDVKSEAGMYQAKPEDLTLTTDANGEVSFSLEEGGRFVARIRHEMPSRFETADVEFLRLYYPFEVVYE